jgi:polyisoprenoid-binding protein YceI
VVYTVLPASRVDIHTGKAGLLGFAGHEHLIRAAAVRGRVVYFPAHPDSSRVEITIPTDSLVVLSPSDTVEVRKVTAAMRTDVLAVEHFPEIRLASTAVTSGNAVFRVAATLTLHGVSKPITVDVHTSIGADTVRAAGTFTVLQTAFGIRPYRGGPGGTVRVADQIALEFAIVAVRR